MGSHRQVCTLYCQDEISEVCHGSSPRTLSSHSCILFYCKVWRTRVHDLFDILLGSEQRVSNRMCPYRGTQRIQCKFSSVIYFNAISCSGIKKRSSILDRQIDFSLQTFVQGPEQNALGNVLVVFLMIGLFSGVVLDWLWLIGKGW